MATVKVTNLSSTTTPAVLDHFFSFCGAVTKLEVAPDGTSATVQFAKPAAAKTALMLSGGTLEGSTITVTSDDVEAPAVAAETPTTAAPELSAEDKEKADLEQEDKPHTAKVAEYLAHGYALSDTVIQKAIAADQQYGISQRFLSYFNPVATKATTTASPHVSAAQAKLAEIDEKRGISLKANAASIIGLKYYQQALSSPLGAKVHAFYTNTSKQALDVHEEALRIKESKKAAAAPTEEPAKVDTATATTAPAAPL